MKGEDICGTCNNVTPPAKRKAKKTKTNSIKWICCDTCLVWFHSVCVRISDPQMESASDFLYFCETCGIRGCLVPKQQTAPPSANADIDSLRKTIEELSAQLAQLRTDLNDARAASKKQFDRFQGKLHHTDRLEGQCAAQNQLVKNLDEKLESIEEGAKLARICSKAVNSCRLAVNKIPYREGENVSAIVRSVLVFLGIQSELLHVDSCFRIPVKPSKWTDRSLTPTIVIVFDSVESKQAVLKRYFERHKEAKLCNLEGGPSLNYRFTLNEMLSISTFRIRNLALRLKQNKLVESVFIKNDGVSVLLPGNKRYLPVESVNMLRELADHSVRSENSSVFYDALPADISASTQC